MILAAAIAGCASSRRREPTAVQPQFDRVEALVSTGCYACLAEAVQLYARGPSGSRMHERAIRQRQLALTLMAFRERELALPNSGADRAVIAIPWASPLPLDVFAMVLRQLDDRDKPIDTDSPAPADATTTALTQLLTKPATRNVAVAYALAITCPRPASSDIPASSDWWVQIRRANLSLRYAELTCSTAAAADDASVFIERDPRFAEVHYQSGLAALYHGQLISAHEQFALAWKGLPHSAVVTLSLANTSLALSRFEEALHLFTAPHGLNGQPSALLGQAKALTYLGRHVEAVTILSSLIERSAPSPGENYYWRAWNLLSMSQSQAAHKDALEALRFWPSSHVERLAGLTARALAQYNEARVHFTQALALDPGDCESRSYLAQMDAKDNMLRKALDGLDASASCFNRAIADQEAALLAGVVKAQAGEILRLEQWQASSLYGAAIVAKVLGQRELALGYARRLLGDPRLGGLARDFILDIDVPATTGDPSILSVGIARPPSS
ncbi:MAG: tetratricopeptide repeat protein [Vicinamibacterales bacterium]